jgi:hypothetical protein
MIGLLMPAILAILAAVASGETGALRLDWPESPTEIPEIRVFGAPQVRFDGDEVEEHRPVDLVRRSFKETAVDWLLGDEVRALGGKVVTTADAVLVSGSEEALAFAGRRWQAVTRFVTGRARLTVSLFEAGSALDATDPAALAASLAKTPDRPVWTARFATIRGRTAIRESVTSHPFVMGHEAQLAQWAAIVQPVTGVLITGRRLAVQCRPLSSHEAAVTLSLHVSADPGGMEPVNLPGGTIHLPEVEFLSVLAEMRLAPGKPQAILLPHPTRDGHLAVVVTVDGLPSDEDRPVGLFDVLALTGHPGRAIPVVSESDGGDEPDAAGREGAVFARLLRIEDLGYGVEDLSHAVHCVMGKPAEKRKIAQMLASRGVRVVLRRERRSLPWLDLLKRPDFDPIRGTVDAGAGAPDSRLLAPLVSGTPLQFLRGTWRRRLADLTAGTAQGAGIVSPVVKSHFEGESFRAWRVGEGVSIHRKTTVLLSRERRDLRVFKDVEGRRGKEAGHLIDAFRVAETSARLHLGGGTTVDLRREGDRAVGEFFSIER